MKSLKEIILNIKTPLLATFFFAIANAYFNTYISIVLYKLNVNEFELGVISNAFYVGIFLGSLFSVRYIKELGYSKSYQLSLLLYFIAVLFVGLTENKFIWLILRFMAGWALAAIWIIAESWILEESTQGVRGKMLSIYILSLSISNALGQLLIGFLEGYENFALVAILGMIVISFIIIFLFDKQVAITSIGNKGSSSVVSLFLKTSSSFVVIITAGALAATIYSIIPYCFELMKFDNSYISILLFVTVTGGSIFQYPIGYLADNFSKKKLLLSIFLTIALIAILIIFSTPHTIIYLLSFFLLGGLVCSIYPVGTNYICDNLEDINLLDITKTLILSYSVGCMIGPMLAPIFIYKFGALGVLWFFSICSLVVFSYLFILKEKKL